MDDSGSLKVRWVQGFTNSKVAFVDEKTACYVCGNYIVFLNVETKTRKVLQSPGHGIGVFTANGLYRTLAFSEQKRFPSIFVYRYPELKVKCDLKGKAKLSYTALALSDNAQYLASCSSLPDYTITVWNLERGHSICSNRLAEEDVTTLLFNPVSWQQICTVNPKSLTVWNIERCNEVHIMNPSVIDLSSIDGAVIDKKDDDSYIYTVELTYSGPQMPTSVIAGLIGERADKILGVKPRLSPSAICWSVSSDLYVGTNEGFLLLVNIESLLVSILYNPHTKQSPTDYIESSGIQEGSFQSMALHSKEVFATGPDGVLQMLRIKENQVEVVETLTLLEPISSLCFSPDYETLLLSSTTGCIYKYNPGFNNEVDKVLDVLCGDFIAAVPEYTEMNACVSVRESGQLQLWSLEDGDCIASISLQTKVTCLACCPIAQYVAVGAVTGHVLFVDLTRSQRPRLVHNVHLYHVPVEHLVFDQGANFLITGAFDSHIFLLDARPSKAFKIIGYIDAMGATVSLSTQYQVESKTVDVLVLSNSEKKNRTDTEHKEGNLIMFLSLSIHQISDTANCVDARGHLREQVISQTCVYEIPHSLSSCVLGTKTIFGYCHKKKVLQRYHLPESMVSNNQKVRLTPEKEVEGHPIGPALLSLSLNQSWLASFGRDGLIRIYDIATLDTYVQKQCHSWWFGGVRSVSFTPDSQTLITTGHRDGSLVCSRLSLKMAGLTQDGKYMLVNFEDKLSKENPILSDMVDWEPPSEAPAEVSNGSQGTNDITDKNEGYKSLPSATPCNSTWLDNNLNTVLKEECQQYAETMGSLKKSVEELQEKFQAIMEENEKLPEMEKLEQLEFNLDVDEQQSLQVVVEQEAAKVRKEIELENLEKRYLQDVLKKKYWDFMSVKRKSIKGHVEVETGDFTAEYSDSWLLHRSVVEDLNNSIRALGEQMIASMVECKDLHKGNIQQEWNHKRMSMHTEDHKNNASEIQMLHLSKEVQEYLIETNYDNKLSTNTSALRNTRALQEEIHTKNMKSDKKVLEELNRKVNMQKEINASWDLQSTNIQVVVAERENIYLNISAMNMNPEHGAKQHYQNILQRKNLVDLDKAQDTDIDILNAEMEYMHMKTFPSSQKKP
ncbi:cilia- and flagella-associated protein 43-like [Tachysurus ichikawai]